MEEPKFHLLNDFGIHKSNIQRNLAADYGQRNDDWSNRVRALLIYDKNNPVQVIPFSVNQQYAKN